MTSEARTRTRNLAVACLALLLSVLVWFNYSAVLPPIVAEWGLSGTRAGVVFAAFQVGYLLAIVPMGWLADRYRPRWVIAIGGSGTGAASLAFAFLADGFLAGTLLRLLAGTFVAGVYVPGMRFVTDWYPQATRGRALGLYVGTFSLGSALSFLFATWIADAVDWRTAIAVTSVGALAVGPLVLGLSEDSPAGRRRKPTPFDLSILRNRAYLATVGAYAWHNWEVFGAWNWLLAFLLVTPAVASVEASPFVAGLLVAVVTLMMAVGNVVGGWLSDRIGRVEVVALGLAGSALVSASLGFLGTTLPLTVLVVVLVAYGTLLAVDSTAASTLVTEVVADEHVGTALSVQSFVGFVPTVLSPVVFGLALDHWGYGLAWPTLAAGAVVGLGCIAALKVADEFSRSTA